jgi:hypothetical protein
VTCFLYRSDTKLSTASTPLEDYEHCRDRLRETLDQLLSLDYGIQDPLDDSEYTTGVEVAEEYSDSVKRAPSSRFHTKGHKEGRLKRKVYLRDQ